ncbi:energy transducer TonB [Pseudomonas sp. CGJS7]|uniref:energy transducer TonB n=1 Tax=Pseudomonas sp. CGJS7 TaxID=3109348 RepID=UPI00300AEA82
MDAATNPNAQYSPLRIGAISGAVSLHAALLLALTLPVAASIQHGDEFFVPYEQHWDYSSLRDLWRPYYRYGATGAKLKTIVAAASFQDGRPSALPEIAAAPDKLPLPIDARTRTFNERPRTVELRIAIAATGAVMDVAIVRSSGDRDLDNAALLNAWQHWRFKPARDRGREVVSALIVAIEFDFHGQSEQASRHEPWHGVVY